MEIGEEHNHQLTRPTASKISVMTSRKRNMATSLEGMRVEVDWNLVMNSFPHDKTGCLSPAGIRYQRLFEIIKDATNQCPFVTDERENDIEIATNYFGNQMKTIRIPKEALVSVLNSNLKTTPTRKLSDK